MSNQELSGASEPNRRVFADLHKIWFGLFSAIRCKLYRENHCDG